MSEAETLLPELPNWVDPVRAYVGTVVAVLVALVGGSLLFPRQVYAGFIWKYFWGPVYADAHGASCAVMEGGTGPVQLHGTKAACSGAQYGAVVGYNTVNEIGYAATLVFAVVGVVMALRHMEIGDSPDLFYGLLPVIFLGGAVRVLEDANNAAVRAGAEPMFSYPWNTFIISPVIYFTLFGVSAVVVLGSLELERREVIDSYHHGIAGATGAMLVLTLGVLLVMSFTTAYVRLLPQFTIVVLALATLVTWAVWQGIEEYAPGLNEGTGRMGAIVLWGHAVDGTANVVGLDWGGELGYPGGDLVGKHPVNRAIVDVTGSVLPAGVTDVVGTAWPFLLVKIAVVLFVLSVFDEAVFEDSPRYAILMLVAILAVGLGPGTRDMLRATFGI